jgi:hypothetical protein
LGRRLRDLAPGLSARAVLEKFAAVQMLDVRIPTSDGFVLIRSPSEGRRLGCQPAGALAPSIRAGGERRERTLELQFAFPPVATRNGLTSPPE